MDFDDALEMLEDHSGTDLQYEACALSVCREKERNWVRVGYRLTHLSKLAIVRLEAALDRLREKAERAARG